MHILMIAPEQIAVPPPKGGSVEICMLAIAVKFAEQHKVTLVSRSHSGYPRSSELGNLKIVRVQADSPMRYIRKVVSYIRSKQFDWIQVDNRPRFISSIRRVFPDTPISLFLHSLTFVSKPMSSIEASVIHLDKADLIVANSHSLQQELTYRFPKLAERIRQVHLGVDLQQFQPLNASVRARLRKRYGLEGAYVFAFAGRIIPRKGLPVLIKAISKVNRVIPRVKLVVAGRGDTPYMKRLRKKANRLGVSATFVGYKSHRKMHEVYGMADCLVCPSQRHEAFGLVNVEAMATGIPVIASHNGGMTEIIQQGQNGFLIDNYRDASAFSNLMAILASNRSYSQALGIHARQDMIERFSWENTVQSLNELYGKLLDEREAATKPCVDILSVNG